MVSNEVAAQYCSQYYIVASSMAVRCCLCRRELSESSAFKKRKLFHGEQCKEAKKFFNEVLLEELDLSVNSFEETLNSKAYLCHLCDAYAANYRKYQKNLNQIRAEVISKLSQLTKLSTETASRKRSAPVQTNDISSVKRKHYAFLAYT